MGKYFKGCVILAVVMVFLTFFDGKALTSNFTNHIDFMEFRVSLIISLTIIFTIYSIHCFKYIKYYTKIQELVFYILISINGLCIFYSIIVNICMVIYLIALLIGNSFMLILGSNSFFKSPMNILAYVLNIISSTLILISIIKLVDPNFLNVRSSE